MMLAELIACWRTLKNEFKNQRKRMLCSCCLCLRRPLSYYHNQVRLKRKWSIMFVSHPSPSATTQRRKGSFTDLLTTNWFMHCHRLISTKKIIKSKHDALNNPWWMIFMESCKLLYLITHSHLMQTRSERAIRNFRWIKRLRVLHCNLPITTLKANMNLWLEVSHDPLIYTCDYLIYSINILIYSNIRARA